MTTHKIGYLIGSLAKGSINRKLAKALVRLAPPELEMSEISFKDLPLYSYDYDADFPPVARDFKAAIAAVDGILFVTPEYNRSIPGGLKNAIDWASRPYGKNSFSRKPSAVIGTSPGAIGTAVAQQSLRSVLSFCNSPQMNAPKPISSSPPGSSATTAKSRWNRPRNSCEPIWQSTTPSSCGCFRCCRGTPKTRHANIETPRARHSRLAVLGLICLIRPADVDDLLPLMSAA